MRQINNIAYRCANHFISKPESVIHKVFRKLLGESAYYKLICNVELLPIRDNYSCSKEQIAQSNEVIIQFDGKIYNTGLADRLRAITSIYHFCKENGLVFKINFVHPFCLDSFLVPNTYDWKVGADEIRYGKNISIPMAILSYARIFGEKKNIELQKEQLSRLNSLLDKQIHLYSNCFCNDDSFYDDFHQLFKPSTRLERLLQSFISEIGKPYISASFRFTQLLGDLKDTYGQPLREDDQKKLISKCIRGLDNIHQKHPKFGKILVTSDSSTFLKEVSKLHYVYIVPGSVGHIAQSDDDGVAERAFVDMFLVANAKKAYMLRTQEMFKSGFAKRGAMIGGIEFEEIVLE